MNHLALINPENVTEEEARVFGVREAARAIVSDDRGMVALLHSAKYDYYNLPGGGIEQDESPETALRRECLEEIGCSVEITGEIGIIVEYRKRFTIRQTSYCFTAKVIGEKGEPHLMEDEIEEGFHTVWLPLDKALEKVRKSDRGVYEAQYMVARDAAFIEAAMLRVD